MDKKLQILASGSQTPELQPTIKQKYYDKCIVEYIKKSKEKFWSVKVFCLVLFSGFYHSLDKGNKDFIQENWGNAETTGELYDFLLVNIKETPQQKENDEFYSCLKQAFLSYLSMFKSEYNKMEGIDKCKKILDYLDSFVNNDSKAGEVKENEKRKPKITDDTHIYQSKADVDCNSPNSINPEQRIEETKNEHETDSTIRSETDEITCIILKIINVVLDPCNVNDENINETLKIEFYSLINNQIKCENKICGSLNSILQSFDDGVMEYQSLEAKQTISNSKFLKRNAAIVVNMIEKRKISLHYFTEYIDNVSQFLEDISKNSDILKKESNKELFFVISERISNLKLQNEDSYAAWANLLDQTACNLGKKFLKSKSIRYVLNCEIKVFKTNCIVENMYDILFLFYDIHRFVMKAGLLYEDNDTTGEHSDTNLMESLKKIYSTFEEYILPILMCYVKKGDGKICYIDTVNVKDFFQMMLENYEDPRCIYQSSFRYALNSVSDIFESLEFNKNLLERNINYSFSEFFEFIEHFEVQHDKFESCEYNIAGED